MMNMVKYNYAGLDLEIIVNFYFCITEKSP